MTSIERILFFVFSGGDSLCDRSYDNKNLENKLVEKFVFSLVFNTATLESVLKFKVVVKLFISK